MRALGWKCSMGKQSLMLLQWVQHHGAARRLMHASGVGQQRHAPRNDTYLSHTWCLPRAEADVLPLHTHHKSPREPPGSSEAAQEDGAGNPGEAGDNFCEQQMPTAPFWAVRAQLHRRALQPHHAAAQSQPPEPPCPKSSKLSPGYMPTGFTQISSCSKATSPIKPGQKGFRHHLHQTPPCPIPGRTTPYLRLCRSCRQAPAQRAERSLHVLLLQAGCSAHPGCCKATRGCFRLSSSTLTPLPTAVSCSCSLTQLAPAAAPSRVGPPWGAPASSKPPPAGQAGKAPSPSCALRLSVLPVSATVPALPSCGSHGAAKGPSHKGAGCEPGAVQLEPRSKGSHAPSLFARTRPGCNKSTGTQRAASANPAAPRGHRVGGRCLAGASRGAFKAPLSPRLLKRSCVIIRQLQGEECFPQICTTTGKKLQTTVKLI